MENSQEITSISTIFQMYFKHSQIYNQRINYSMYEYQTHSIPFKKRCAKTVYHFISTMYVAFMLIITQTKYIPSLRFIIKIQNEMTGFDMQLLSSFSAATLLLKEYKWYTTVRQLLEYRYPLNEILIKYGDTIGENLDNHNQLLLVKYFIRSNRFTKKLNRFFRLGFYFTTIKMIIMLMEYVADEKIDWNQFFIGAIFTIIMFININHFIIGFSMEMIYLIFSLGYLTSYMKQLIDEMKQWQSIWNRRMAIFQYNIRRQYLRHYNEMINFNNMHCNFLMFIEIMSKSLVLIIVIACGKTMNLSINNFLKIMKNSLKCFMIGMQKINQTYSYRSNISSFKRIIYLRETIERNLFLQTITRNHYGFYFGQIFFIDKMKLVEMFMFNFVFFTMLYKKIVI
ncbi:hypothetical protein DERF_011978 [Dermatophagoides farinae]|uniref:Uncharacterized protein n=1 Tax=Dermatophagoides farinae TaxID=6954 RepID=A0A922HR91_DERFA|nr:hypothetical protein DERF_011978 [Dermatophagoides farinae]